MTRGEQLVAMAHIPPVESGLPVQPIRRVKRQAADLIDAIEDLCPPGRWRSLACTAVEEACMWAVKSLTNTPPAGGTQP